MTRKKSWLPLLILLCLLLTACQLIGWDPGIQLTATAALATSSAPLPTAPREPSNAPVPTAALTTPAVAEMVLSAKKIEQQSENPNVSINARWPYLEWGTVQRANAFNRAAEALATGEIESFKASLTQQSNDPNFAGLSSSLQMDFMPTNETNGILAVLYQISFYSAGAAHPGHTALSLNYDLQNGKVLALPDLFQPGSAYLDTLSSDCIQDLKSRQVLDWEDGALPKAENFQVWNITPNGLLISFDEYQVSSYAAGPQSVLIPYEKLKDIARPDGPLKPYLAR